MTARIRSSLLTLFLLAILFAAGSATAAKVDLSGSTSDQTGTQKLSVEDVGNCSEFFSLDITFLNKKKWSAVDNLGTRFSGKYKQSKSKGGRKITATFDSKSKKKLTGRLKQLVKACANVDSASVDIQKIKVKGTVNKDQNSVKINGKVELEGKAGGEKGEATYTFKTTGSLVFP